MTDLPYTGRYDQNANCACASEHRPPVLTYQWHHIRPLAMGGEDTKYGVPNRNGIWLCSTTHDNVHEILRLMVSAKGLLGYRTVQRILPRPVSYYAWQIATDGYRRWANNEWAEIA